MIQSITVTNHLGESLELELAAPEKSGLLISSIDGLGPVQATINTTELATSDGAIYNSARAGSRNVVLGLKFLWNPTIEETRLKTYKYFPIKRKLTLTIKTDQRTSIVDGYVEKNQPTIFNELAGCQVSIVCPDAYLYSIEKQVTILSSVVPSFSFPFSNAQLEEPTLVMGTYQDSSDKNVFYAGDADVGVDIYASFTGDVTNFRLYNSNTQEAMQIDDTKLIAITGGGITTGDIIEIHTQTGQKSIYLHRGGAIINILNALTKESDWFKLQKGDNVFSYIVDSGDTFVEVRIENQTVYEGA